MGATLSNKDNIFIDANIFIYYVEDHPVFADACEKLLLSVETKKSIGVTSIFVLNEVFHKMMILEACDRFDIGMGRAVRYLKNNPQVVTSLTTCRENIERIRHITNLRVIEVPSRVFNIAINFSWRYGLLTTDAIHVATMREYNIRTIATNDRDFKRIEWLSVWKP